MNVHFHICRWSRAHNNHLLQFQSQLFLPFLFSCALVLFYCQSNETADDTKRPISLAVFTRKLVIASLIVWRQLHPPMINQCSPKILNLNSKNVSAVDVSHRRDWVKSAKNTKTGLVCWAKGPLKISHIVTIGNRINHAAVAQSSPRP